LLQKKQRSNYFIEKDLAMIKPVKLSDTLVVSAQPALEDFAPLAAQGFKVVVCNRPDGETADQPLTADVRQAVEAAGMTFVDYPITPAIFPGDDLAKIGRLFDGSEGKVFAFCRTGTRCTNLWVASRPVSDRDAADAHAKALGYDLTLAEKFS
jgi:sulfide:quinone oxidoreductase